MSETTWTEVKAKMRRRREAHKHKKGVKPCVVMAEERFYISNQVSWRPRVDLSWLGGELEPG